MKKSFFAGFIALFAMLPVLVIAHPGRTDSYGCHTCRTNCSKWGLTTGEYHCHRAKSLPQPIEPIKSHKETPITKGYTTPAPEYKAPAQPKVEKVEVNNIKVVEPVKTTGQNKSESWLSRLFKSLFNK